MDTTKREVGTSHAEITPRSSSFALRVQSAFDDFAVSLGFQLTGSAHALAALPGLPNHSRAVTIRG